MAAASALQHLQGDVHEQREEQQNETEGERETEVTLAGVEGDGGGERACLTADVAADGHRRADLGDDVSERGRDHGGERESGLARDVPRRAPPPGAERLGGATDAR